MDVIFVFVSGLCVFEISVPIRSRLWVDIYSSPQKIRPLGGVYALLQTVDLRVMPSRHTIALTKNENGI